jgi:hypothetical protein
MPSAGAMVTAAVQLTHPLRRVRRGFALSMLVAAYTTAWPTTARSEESRARTSSLSWVRMPGAESCVATQDLAQRVEARLGRPVFVSAAQADVSVEGLIEPAGPGRGYRAMLTLRDAHGAALGTRELARADASCDAMREPLALVIAVMIDPDAALGPKAQPTVSVPTPEAPPPVVIEKPVYIAVPSPPAPPKPTWNVEVGAGFASTVGLLPNVGFGIAASGLVTPPGLFPFEGFGAAWFDDPTTTSSGSVSVSFLEVGGGLCPLHYEGPRLHVALCGLGELGLLTGRVSGGSPDRPLYLGVAVEGRLAVRLVGPLALRAGVSPTVPLTPRHIDGFRLADVAAVADVGLGLLFP